jgi:hypothetical protein
VGDLIVFGQGSEWLWSFAQFITVAVTLVAIYRQLIAQRSAAHYEHVTAQWHEFESIPFVRAKLALMLALRGRDPAAGLPPDTDEVADYFQRLGYLAARGHYEVDSLWEDGSWQVIGFYWGLLQPYIRSDRTASGDPDLYGHFEWLDGEMRRLSAKRGKPRPAFDESKRDQLIADRIAIFKAKLAREQPDWGERS